VLKVKPDVIVSPIEAKFPVQQENTSKEK
jgi:hypothetical protein